MVYVVAGNYKFYILLPYTTHNKYTIEYKWKPKAIKYNIKHTTNTQVTIEGLANGTYIEIG